MNDKNEVLIQVQDTEKRRFGKIGSTAWDFYRDQKRRGRCCDRTVWIRKIYIFAVSESVGGSNRRNCFI